MQINFVTVENFLIPFGYVGRDFAIHVGLSHRKMHDYNGSQSQGSGYASANANFLKVGFCGSYKYCFKYCFEIGWRGHSIDEDDDFRGHYRHHHFRIWQCFVIGIYISLGDIAAI